MNGFAGTDEKDFLAAEEPLEIQLESHSVAIVMRTPGEDRELAAGFLVTEGLVHESSDLTGKLLALREDVGRHTALDKVVGWALLGDRLPLRQHILLLSGRTSFEMMQKALAAGIPIVAAISAPSTLAAAFTQDSSQTLVGFLRGERMNIYAGANRVRQIEPSLK